MKINQDMRLNIDKIRQDQKQQPGGGIRFNEMVVKQEHKLQLGQMQQLMKEVESAGERLARFRTFKDLAKFKPLVKQFVKEAVSFEMELKHSHSWNEYGEGRSLKLVENIDEKLVELTEELMDNKDEQIDILGKVGEIKGLLINLYT
ncbi:YaaR family protein [Bacillus sp. ISL-45]|uniref:YaaR family protein n=1 Tax=Bacillus sp. ISL-45 TaxID=2819128 RepID=UPI001BE7202C|nr:YaaR family protein [Bacillus sp. ISL-45]MBT2662918.1 YaaR family protein [Bacillus sp. ISL-45]